MAPKRKSEVHEQKSRMEGKYEDEGFKEWLVFPGLSSCRVERPPREFWYCGRKKYGEILDRIWDAVNRDSRVFLLTGPKGSGKSCILRALAAELLWVVKQDNVRLVFFWYLDAMQPLSRQVQDAFLFTFSDDVKAVASIDGIDTPEKAAAFLQERKNQGETIWLVTDGEERLDSSTDSGEPQATRRAAARTWLDEISKEASFILKALSPGAAELHQSLFQASPAVYHLDCLMTEAERDSLIEGTALGANLLAYPERLDAVDDLAGYHPLSLSLLIKYCNEATGLSDGMCGTRKIKIDRTRRLRFRLKSAEPSSAKQVLGPAAGPPTSSNAAEQDQTARAEGPPPAAEAHPTDPVTAPGTPAAAVAAPELPDPLLDGSAWDEVVKSFKRDAIFKEMRESVRKAEAKEIISFGLLCEKFPAYAITGGFCTPFIERIYVEEASKLLPTPG